MKEMIIALVMMTTVVQAMSLKKLQRKLKRELKVDINVKDDLLSEKDYCTRLALESWYHWWKEVKSPYKDTYLAKIQTLDSLDIKSSLPVQSIEGKYTSVYLVKKYCTGSGLGRSCQTKDSTSIKLKVDVTKTGEDPKFGLKIGKIASIDIEYSDDMAVSKRYDTFSRVVFENVERDNKLFDRYSRFGQIYQLVRPGTDSSLKRNCSFPRLDQIITRLK